MEGGNSTVGLPQENYTKSSAALRTDAPRCEAAGLLPVILALLLLLSAAVIVATVKSPAAAGGWLTSGFLSVVCGVPHALG